MLTDSTLTFPFSWERSHDLAETSFDSFMEELRFWKLDTSTKDSETPGGFNKVLYSTWTLFLSTSPCPSHFALGFLTRPTRATDHPFVSVAGAQPFQEFVFPSFAAAAHFFLVYTPPSFYYGLLHFDRPAWKVDLSNGPTEHFHIGDLVHINQEGRLAGGEVKQVSGYMNGSGSTVRLLVKGVWSDDAVGRHGEFFYLIVPALRASRSAHYPSPSRWLLDDFDHSAVDPYFNQGWVSDYIKISSRIRPTEE